MTDAEFQEWYDHFEAAFPAVRDFVRKSDPTGEATLKLWFGVLGKRDINDVLEVTNRLFEGRLPIPWLGDKGFHDWSAVPRHVSRLCGELHPVEPEWKQHTVRSRAKVGIIEGDPLCAQALQGALKILDEGGSKAQMCAYLDAFFGCKQSPAAARDKGNYEPAFDAFNQS